MRANARRATPLKAHLVAGLATADQQLHMPARIDEHILDFAFLLQPVEAVTGSFKVLEGRLVGMFGAV